MVGAEIQDVNDFILAHIGTPEKWALWRFQSYMLGAEIQPVNGLITTPDIPGL